MFNILTLNKIAACGLTQLPEEHFFVSDATENPDGIILRSYAMSETDLAPPNLKAIARAGAGVNNIPVESCAEKGIVVFNTPGANANAVKELVIAGLLLSSRRVVAGINWTQSLAGQSDVAKTVEKGKAQFVGPELYGKKLGVIGLGAIGVLVANACHALGMDVTGFDPGISIDAAWALSRGVHKAASLDTLYAESDYITMHVPANSETKKMYGDFFDKCKKGIRLMNFSRGEVVDNKALLQAIADGVVECYVTDFPTEELLGQEKIITVPHLGASTPESEDNCAIMAARQLQDYLLYGNIKNSVNFPDCDMTPTGRKRICVIHRNVVNVVGSITTALAKKSLNIDNMINKSKGNYAYTVIEVDGEAVDGVAEALLGLDAVIRVRVI